MSNDPNNGMMTKVWGPPGWFFLHSVAAGYPVDPTAFDIANGNVRGSTAMHYRTAFENIGHVLPCKYCRNSYNQFITELPMTREVLSGRKALEQWLWKIHDMVNAKLGTKSESQGAVTSRYESYRAKCRKGAQTGCTIPLSGFKLKSCVVVYPDICIWKIARFAAFVSVIYLCIKHNKGVSL